MMARSTIDFTKLAGELEWLKRYPYFEERPASIVDFVDEGYLDIKSKIRPGVMDALVRIFGDKSNGKRIAKLSLAMFTGGIGIGKTTLASIALPYMAHWVLCLKNPQDFYNLLPGSRIAFMQMSTSEAQASQVVFGDIKARIENSRWFIEKYPFDKKWTKQLRFPKDVWVLPGDSAETTFEGYNILGGILDEADSHKVTDSKDYAEDGFNTIHARISSRFEDKGLFIVIGQMKKANGFVARKYREMIDDPQAHVVRMAIWESRGWQHYQTPEGENDSFFYDSHRKMIIPTLAAGMVTSDNIIEIPKIYENDFKNNPERALRDLAGIPPATGDPFISMVHKIERCRDLWQTRERGIGSPVSTSATNPTFEKWFTAPTPLKRVIHIDMAYSGNGDALGMAMGHVQEMIDIDDEYKPYIVFDFLLRIKAAPGQEIILGDVRKIIYNLRDDRNFKIAKVTIDGFQSQDTIQQLNKRRIYAEYLSIDRLKLPYEDLREAIYEERVEFPPYMTQLKPGNHKLVEIAYRELSELTDTGKKIDHQPDGSKDVADAMAGVVYTLMAGREYHKKRSTLTRSDFSRSSDGNSGEYEFRLEKSRAPIPTSNITGLGRQIPRHLMPRWR